MHINKKNTAPGLAKNKPATVAGNNLIGSAPPLDKESLKQNLMDSLEVQQLLHICRGTLYNWRKSGLITFSKIGGRIYFEAAEVYLALKVHKQKNLEVAA